MAVPWRVPFVVPLVAIVTMVICDADGQQSIRRYEDIRSRDAKRSRRGRGEKAVVSLMVGQRLGIILGERPLEMF